MLNKIKSWIGSFITYDSEIFGNITGKLAAELYDREVRAHLATKKELADVKSYYDNLSKLPVIKKKKKLK